MSRKKISLMLVFFLTPVLYFGLSADQEGLASVNNAQAVVTEAADTNVLLPQMIALPKVAKNTLPNSALFDADSSLSTIERIRALQEKTDMHRAMLKDHDEFNRYPSNNQRIQKVDSDPLIKNYAIDERTTISDDKTNSLTIWSDKKYYIRGDLVTVSAYVSDEKGTRIPSTITAQLIFDEAQNIQVLDFKDLDHDAIYEVSFRADEVNEQALKAGIYKVLIVSDASELLDSVAFVLADPEATFTGNYRDALTAEGDLLVEAEVEVTSADRFYFQASLYTELGDPIGGNQMTLNLNKGKAWVPFKFYGLMMHDAQVNGPYLLKNIALARVTMPMQRAPLIHPGYFTNYYPLSKFSNVRYEEVVGLK
jgi:hypothetical protein